jgi:hypothetical protein
MDRDPPNPYRDMTLRELHQVMNERAGQLLKGGQVSRRDIAYLLLAGAWPLAPNELWIGKPAHRVRHGTGVVEAFLPEYEDDVRAVMHNVFEHARYAAEVSWDEYHGYAAMMRDRGTPIGWGVGTEEEFRQSLAQLQEIKDLRAKGWRPPSRGDG